MHLPEHILDVFLQPGEFYWGDTSTRIRTILGSCVSIIFWHPKKKEGGMCHYVLPESSIDELLEMPYPGRYGNGAWELFMKEIYKTHTKPNEYQIKIFGGSSLFSNQEEGILRKTNIVNVGEKNILFAKKRMAENNLHLVSENVGGLRPRRIHFEIWSGNVWLKRL
ncbi:MAG: chemotaxis protein CheD [Leptospiraceae bacterium]|nr:chemotaxis protein CheD [Leptospiraceae bacterium]